MRKDISKLNRNASKLNKDIRRLSALSDTYAIA
jgi:hypothetical protein